MVCWNIPATTQAGPVRNPIVSVPSLTLQTPRYATGEALNLPLPVHYISMKEKFLIFQNFMMILLFRVSNEITGRMTNG